MTLNLGVMILKVLDQMHGHNEVMVKEPDVILKQLEWTRNSFRVCAANGSTGWTPTLPNFLPALQVLDGAGG